MTSDLIAPFPAAGSVAAAEVPRLAVLAEHVPAAHWYAREHNLDPARWVALDGVDQLPEGPLRLVRVPGYTNRPAAQVNALLSALTQRSPRGLITLGDNPDLRPWQLPYRPLRRRPDEAAARAALRWLFLGEGRDGKSLSVPGQNPAWQVYAGSVAGGEAQIAVDVPPALRHIHGPDGRPFYGITADEAAAWRATVDRLATAEYGTSVKAAWDEGSTSLMLALDRPATSRVTAVFAPQRWVRDTAVPADDQPTAWWDATTYAGRPDMRAYVHDLLGHADDGSAIDNEDRFQNDPAAPDLVRSWAGPFTIRLEVTTGDVL